MIRSSKQEKSILFDLLLKSLLLKLGILLFLSELAQKVRIVKNSEKNMNLEALNEQNLSNKFIKIH